MSTTKNTLRRELIARRDALTDREARSAAICARVLALPAFAAAPAIHCYLAMRSEVETRPLIAAALAAGKAVAVPVLERDGRLWHSWIGGLGEAELAPGVFGTPRPRRPRPCEPADWGLIVVPLLGFDRRGYRLGYGKGYYDALLAAAPALPAVGVAFAAQELPLIPDEPHDVPLSVIITESETRLFPETLTPA